MNNIGLSIEQLNLIKRVCKVSHIKDFGKYEELYSRLSSYMNDNMFITMFNSKVVCSNYNYKNYIYEWDYYLVNVPLDKLVYVSNVISENNCEKVLSKKYSTK